LTLPQGRVNDGISAFPTRLAKYGYEELLALHVCYPWAAELTRAEGFFETARKYSNSSFEFTGLFNKNNTVWLDWRGTVPTLYEVCSERDAKHSRIAHMTDTQKEAVNEAHQFLKK
jgi:hypothetical protein